MKNFTPFRGVITTLMLVFGAFLLSAQSIDSKLEKQEKKFLKEKIKLEDLRFEWIKSELAKVGLPKVKDAKLKAKTEVVNYNAFVLDYNDTHEQANWVMHMILPQAFEICEERTEDFREDLSFKLKSATAREYSGLLKNKTDRGHLAPAADLRWSERAVSSSFYYSNMSPQSSKLNQGRWADLEKFMRAYVKFYENDPIVIISGPILKDLNKGTVKKLNNITDGVSIPKRYYKIALDIKRNRAIGFVMDQKTTKRKAWKSLIKSIDEIEKMTGIDFFSKLSKKKEDALEKQKDLSDWDVYASIKKASPVATSKLSKGVMNTKQLKTKAETLVGEKVKVIGKVLIGSRDPRGGYVNLILDDTKNPVRLRFNKDQLSNFNYKPEKELRGALVTASGKVEVKKSFGKTYVYVVVEKPSDLKIEY